MATLLARRNAPLGDLVVAAFDRASHLSADPREVSRWTRLIFQCADPPLGLLERAAVALARGAVGGRGTW